ncbi:unnamed protein product, partial [Amoebophrya sp. A120]
LPRRRKERAPPALGLLLLFRRAPRGARVQWRLLCTRQTRGAGVRVKTKAGQPGAPRAPSKASEIGGEAIARGHPIKHYAARGASRPAPGSILLAGPAANAAALSHSGRQRNQPRARHAGPLFVGSVSVLLFRTDAAGQCLRGCL